MSSTHGVCCSKKCNTESMLELPLLCMSQLYTLLKTLLGNSKLCAPTQLLGLFLLTTTNIQTDLKQSLSECKYKPTSNQKQFLPVHRLNTK